MLQIFDELLKIDPELAQALQAFRQSGMRQHADTIARHLFSDKMVPKMGNKAAYEDFLTRNKAKGIHVHADLNDFGQINKLHGEQEGDKAIKAFGNTAAEVSRMFGGKSFRNGGDEFKFHFQKPEQAHGFARELRSRLENLSPAGGTHNIATSIGMGYTPEHAEKSMIGAKGMLGPMDMQTGKRKNLHAVGKAPTVVHSLLHEVPPQHWQESAGPSAQPSISSQVPTGAHLSNPLVSKAESEAPGHPAISGGHVGIVTAENPMTSHGRGGNKELEQDLTNQGLRFEPIKGIWDQLENSYIVHGPSSEQMYKLGKRYGQRAVLYSNGGNNYLIFTNGPRDRLMCVGKGVNIFSSEPKNYYSTLVHGGKPVHFSYNVDQDKAIPFDPGI